LRTLKIKLHWLFEVNIFHFSVTHLDFVTSSSSGISKEDDTLAADVVDGLAMWSPNVVQPSRRI
jgi:hypothetical protein